MFTTEHLHLRACVPSDQDNITSVINNVEIAPMILGRPAVPQPQSNIKKFMDDSQNGLLFAIIEELRGGKSSSVTSSDGTPTSNPFVGYILLGATDAKNRGTVLKIALLPSFWGKGYGTEAAAFVVRHAFLELGIHRISVELLEVNERALNMFKKVGFTEEGRKRKRVWYDKAWRDVVCMGMLEEHIKKPATQKQHKYTVVQVLRQ